VSDPGARVGVWSSMFMMAIALSDSCVILVKYCTRFTQEIFGLFVAAIFISEVGTETQCRRD